MLRQPITKSNETVAGTLSAVADLLEDQGANEFRVRAWREAAAAVRALGRPAGDVLRDDGLEGLDAIPGIGQAIARAIRELVETGRLGMYERLLGESDPLALIASVPGVGRKLAERVHVALGIESLEALERADTTAGSRPSRDMARSASPESATPSRRDCDVAVSHRRMRQVRSAHPPEQPT